MNKNPRTLPQLLLVAGGLCLASIQTSTGEEGPAALRARADRMEEKVRALKAEGRAEEAEKLNLEVRELRQLAQREGAPAPGDARPSERRNPKEQMAGPRQKLEHLKIAIEHLHAAGLHPAAERLTRQAEEMAGRLRQGEAGPGREGPGPRARAQRGSPGDVERLRAELDELRRVVRDLQRRLEESRRDQH